MSFKTLVTGHDPCGKYGNCLVKATCKYPRVLPWERQEKCPPYKNYIKRTDFLNKYSALLASMFWGIVFLLMVAFIVFSFILGVYEQFKFVRDWLF